MRRSTKKTGMTRTTITRRDTRKTKENDGGGARGVAVEFSQSMHRPEAMCDWDFEKRWAIMKANGQELTSSEIRPTNKDKGLNSPVEANFNGCWHRIQAVWFGLVQESLPSSSMAPCYRSFGNKSRPKAWGGRSSCDATYSKLQNLSSNSNRIWPTWCYRVWGVKLS